MEKIECPICSNFYTEELFKAKDRFKTDDQIFSVRKCLNCKIVFTFPVLDWEEMKKFYPKIYLWKKEYKAKNKFIKLIRKAEEKYLRYSLKYDTKRLLKFIGKKESILDIGCDTGLRLEVFREKGFKKYYGIEPTERALYAKEIKKLPVEQKTLEEFNCPRNSFDIITLYHVFEHLNNPIYHLKKIKQILKPNGWLVIQIPNFNSFQAKLFKKNWGALDIPRHYFHYTPKTISNLLLQNGFKVKTIDQRMNFLYPMYWASSVPGLDRRPIWQKEDEGKQTFFSRVFWVLLMLLSILPTEFENLSGEGGHMTIYAINQK